MKERPILFSAPMVLALLAGTKTQTRRILKPGAHDLPKDDRGGWTYSAGPGGLGGITRGEHGGVSIFPLPRCPYGVVGDRLWVKETWAPAHGHGEHGTDCGTECGAVRVLYGADRSWAEFAPEAIPDDWTMPKAAKRGNVTPLFMPRWASRITLEVTEVRVERVQEASPEDAMREGIDAIETDEPLSAVDTFAALWDSINGDRASWGSNPWCWVIGFKRIDPSTLPISVNREAP